MIIQFQNANKNLNLWVFPHKKSLATEVTRPFIETLVMVTLIDYNILVLATRISPDVLFVRYKLFSNFQ